MRMPYDLTRRFLLSIAGLTLYIASEHVFAQEVWQIEAAGPLVIIGGAESSDGRILQKFVEMAGNTDAQIVVVPVASQHQQLAATYYEDAFRKLGVKSVQSLPLNSREDASKAEAISLINQSTGIFFSGGDQSRIVEMVRSTPLADAILARNKSGVVLAGTSAGAAMMSRTMIRTGPSNALPARGLADVGKGMMFIRGIVVDQHFSQRGRQGRLLSVLADRPQSLGVGIDENTALLVSGPDFEVVGAGAVSIYDTFESHYYLSNADDSNLLALKGAKLSIIPDGFRFHFQGRTPMMAKKTRPYLTDH